jgi:FAD/FMN-containing dehydrogenase
VAASPISGSPIPVARLRAQLTGQVIEPGGAGYDAAREVQNATIDRRPAMIVRVANAEDVRRTIAFARETGLRLTVRGGGHSPAGHAVADGAVMVDCSVMRNLRIDPEQRLAWAEPGLTAGDYTRAAAAHGLATPLGDSGSVGLAGITLSGGVGFLARKHGLTIDHLISVELVTAAGELLVASETSNPDLFWAVRGGGGNLGIVTRLQYGLLPVDTVYGGVLFLPATRDVLRALVPLAASAPDELTIIANLMPAPPLPFLPVEAHGRPTIALLAVYAGDLGAGERALAPFRALARPIADLVRPMPYPAIYDFTAEAARRTPFVMRSLLLDALEDAKVDGILARMAAPSSPRTVTQIRVLGGAMARVPNAATAFGHRHRPIMVTIITPFSDAGEREQHGAWTQDYADELGLRDAGAYAGFLESEGEARVRSAYPAATHARLAEAKRRYDPENVFAANQNIRPAAGPADG